MTWLIAGAVFIGSALTSVFAVAISIRVARRWHLLDYPDQVRKTQSEPVPKLGGIAVAIAFAFAATVALFLIGRTADLGLAWIVILPSLAAALVGYWDDLRTIAPVPRLLLQAGIGALAWTLGTRAEVTGVIWVDLLITVIWFMAVINGVNLLDNSDGLAAATVLVSSLGAAVIAVLFGQELVLLLAISLTGVCLGYLRYNWFPARVYMGDSGAYFLGTLLASLLIGLRPTGAAPVVGVALALLLAALPILDTTYVVVRRLKAGIHPFTAGRDHLAHRLQDKGQTVAGSVLTLQAGLFVTTAVAIGLAAVQVA